MTATQSYKWVSLVRSAERMMTYRNGSAAQDLCWKHILRDLEELCPSAWRAVVR